MGGGNARANLRMINIYTPARAIAAADDALFLLPLQSRDIRCAAALLPHQDRIYSRAEQRHRAFAATHAYMRAEGDEEEGEGVSSGRAFSRIS